MDASEVIPDSDATFLVDGASCIDHQLHRHRSQLELLYSYR